MSAKPSCLRVPDWVDRESGYSRNEYDGGLYDLGRDLGQKNNLYGRHPEKVAELTGLLARVRERGQVR